MTDHRLLIVMRHAKAQQYADSDQDRALTDRGRAAAREAGSHLAGRGITPDHALVSSAVRARETWEGVADAAGFSAEATYDGAVYAGSPDVVIEALQGAPAEARVVVFVGHNPTAAYLAHLLDDGSGDPQVLREVSEGFPPGALALLEVPVAWADLEIGSARLVGFHVGGTPG